MPCLQNLQPRGPLVSLISGARLNSGVSGGHQLSMYRIASRRVVQRVTLLAMCSRVSLMRAVFRKRINEHDQRDRPVAERNDYILCAAVTITAVPTVTGWLFNGLLLANI